MHLIGPLQSNKVNAALRWASCIESVESLDLAERLSARATEPLDVYVQVNVSGEESKHGVAPRRGGRARGGGRRARRTCGWRGS